MPSDLISWESQSSLLESLEESSPATDSLTESAEAEDLPGSDEAPVIIYSDYSEQILQELQRLNGNLECWFQSPTESPVSVFNGVTIETMISLFFAAFIGGFCLISVSRLIAYLVKKIVELFGESDRTERG